MAEKTQTINLPVIDMTAPDRLATAALIRQACVETGFFYIVNHGIDKEMMNNVFDGVRKLYTLPLEDKIKLGKDKYTQYTALYVEKLDSSPTAKGDRKESFCIGPVDSEAEAGNVNLWPFKELLPSWRCTVETYHRTIWRAAKNLMSLVGLALDLDDKVLNGFMGSTTGLLCFVHYPDNSAGENDEDVLGAAAHSDYGMITLLATDGVPGLQICREKDREPRIWEDVPHIEGALVINIGDMMERWTNNIFRSTLHRVKSNGQERYSVPFFIAPPDEFVIRCLETCCSESNPPRFPPIRAIEYLEERYKATNFTVT